MTTTGMRWRWKAARSRSPYAEVTAMIPARPSLLMRCAMWAESSGVDRGLPVVLRMISTPALAAWSRMPLGTVEGSVRANCVEGDLDDRGPYGRAALGR